MVLTETRISTPVQISSQAKKTAPFPSDWKLWETEVSKLVARAWLDSDFCDSFIADPAGTLQEAGLVLEDFVEVQINQNPDAVPILRAGEGGTVVYELPLPPKPTTLTDEEISAWAEGRVDVAPASIVLTT
ncbi:hypothetical protein LAY57_02430 [Argonema antarcticum A004/B2]|nr:hypothetical protein [Argonema antarcticum A004/B2]